MSRMVSANGVRCWRFFVRLFLSSTGGGAGVGQSLYHPGMVSTRPCGYLSNSATCRAISARGFSLQVAVVKVVADVGHG